MNTTTAATEIYFKTTKNGQPRAYRISRLQFRSFPIGYDEAVGMIATGEAIRVDGPFWKAPRWIHNDGSVCVDSANCWLPERHRWVGR